MNQSMKKLFAPKLRKLLLCAAMLLCILIDLAIMSCEVSETYSSIWTAAFAASGTQTVASLVALGLLLGAIIVSAVGLLATATGKQVLLYPHAIGLGVHIILLIAASLFDLYGFVGEFWIVLEILLSLAGLVYSIGAILLGGSKKKVLGETLDSSSRRRAMLILTTVSELLLLSLFFIPLLTYSAGAEVYRILPVGLFLDQINALPNMIVFIGVFVGCTVSFICYLNSFKRYASAEWEYADKMQSTLLLNTVITGGYFLAGVIWASLRNSKGGEYHYVAGGYLPFLLTILLMVGFAFLLRGVWYEPIRLQAHTAAGRRVEFYLYGLAMSIVTLAACCSDILRVTFPQSDMKAVKLNGWKVLTAMSDAEADFQLVAFFLISIVTVTAALLILSTVSLISKSKFFYKLTLVQVIAGVVSTMLIGLFGKYYEIVQKMNQAALEDWLGQLLKVTKLDVEFKVKSGAIWWMLCALVIAVIVLIRRPYTKGMQAEELCTAPAESREEKKSEAAPLMESEKTLPAVQDNDPCPTFTELDYKIPQYQAEQKAISTHAYEAPTLPGLVQFVVNYARDSRLHLYYSPQDIAAFIAGLGACRLTILQGMSGTGKTSLPKIFSEAVLGNCELVEVESSWRDKNELLGYYNEFSRIYTPKKFTQALYKAALNPDRMTFIVLDEMNLSRVEYYFSDFLSLMEHEEDKRAIKLLNIGLFRIAGGKRYPYYALSEGHTLKVPTNVWFVGTANRDESTFEISDKVYDRAHTMNFNRRAPKSMVQHTEIPQRYLSANELLRLFDEAKTNVRFDLDSSSVVREVEELLAPYNISFGNRVANQIETFVSIYAACFTQSEAVIHEALETILLSKVVSKLEYRSVDDKEELASEFARLKLHRCSEFIRRLHED